MINNIFSGNFQIKREGDWYIPERFTNQQLESYSNTRDLQIRSLAPAGCKLSFYSKAKSLEFTYRITGKARNWAAFDMCEDGLLTDTVLVTEDVGHVKFALSGNENVKTEIFLPHLVELAIKDIKTDAPIKAIEKGNKLWLCLGDSITQGMDAINPSMTYPVLAAKLLNYDVLNMGVGGAMFCAGNLDKIDREPDLITIALGCNDWGSVKDEEELRKNISQYLYKLTSLYSCRKIFGILPIWRSDADTIHSGMTFEQMRQAIKEEYEKYPFISVLDGMTLMPSIKMFYGDEGELKVHPNEKGFLYYAMNLVNEIR